jgi:hypothetical protein
VHSAQSPAVNRSVSTVGSLRTVHASSPATSAASWAKRSSIATRVAGEQGLGDGRRRREQSSVGAPCAPLGQHEHVARRDLRRRDAPRRRRARHAPRGAATCAAGGVAAERGDDVAASRRRPSDDSTPVTRLVPVTPLAPLAPVVIAPPRRCSV